MLVSPLLVIHASAGAVALLSGTAAIIMSKGTRAHARTGLTFTASMLLLGATGVWLAVLRAEIGNIFGGLVTLYIVATAWTAARSPNGRSGAFDWLAAALGLATGLAILRYGVQVAMGRPGAGVPAGMDFFLGGVMLLAVAGDARMISRGGITGRPRIVRHLWRMCFALFEASGSFFMGRQRLFPVAIQRSGLLIALTVLPLLLLVFWVLRVRFARAWRDGLSFRRIRFLTPPVPRQTAP